MVGVKKLGFADRVSFWITVLLILSLVIAIVSAVINQEWFVVFISALALILMFLPTIFERSYEVDIPVEFEIITVLFIYATLFLGEVFGFYYRFWWWDIFLHSWSAIGFGFIGFMILYILNAGGKIKARPITIALFSFSFAMMIGAMWEIFEFTVDMTLGTNMQKSGLLDTMVDLIVNAIGAFVASIIGFFYLKFGKLHFFDRAVTRFEADNPHLFVKG